MATDDATFFGHPRGLATLFFTEMWERFSYYGMRALLILFMTAPAAVGGLGYDATSAGSVYGLYTFGVYALALPGGWVADRLIGQRRRGPVWRRPHRPRALLPRHSRYPDFLRRPPVDRLRYPASLKPNISANVGDLYADDGARRDAGFSIFYMGINLGAFFGPLLCSWLGEPREGVTWGRLALRVCGRRGGHDVRPGPVRRGPAASARVPESSKRTRQQPERIGAGVASVLHRSRSAGSRCARPAGF